ncbi:MAG: hypothetical protein JNM17_04775 [Archangium sp.]|nr:hypothetical protein [Archangium sp.]
MRLALAVVVLTAHLGFAQELSNAQSNARAQFFDQMSEVIPLIKEQCGFEAELKPEFERFDKMAWARDFPGTTCRLSLETVVEFCALPPEVPDPKKKNKTRPREPLKQVRCVFEGGQPERDGDDLDDLVQRNIEFKDGVLTVHLVPRMGNVEQTTLLVLLGELRRGGLKSGAKCSKNEVCRSAMCSAGSCQTCSDTVSCADGFDCLGGTCMRSAVGKRDKKKNVKCAYGSDCVSGRCSFVKASSEHRCE